MIAAVLQAPASTIDLSGCVILQGHLLRANIDTSPVFRLQERHRLRDILCSPEAAHRQGLARHFAFHTGFAADNVVGMLATMR